MMQLDSTGNGPAIALGLKRVHRAPKRSPGQEVRLGTEAEETQRESPKHALSYKPDGFFARHALALELSKSGPTEALPHFEYLVRYPDCAAILY